MPNTRKHYPPPVSACLLCSFFARVSAPGPRVPSFVTSRCPPQLKIWCAPPASAMACGTATPLAPVPYRTVLLIWLLSGLVGGFLVCAPRSSLPRGEHAAHSSRRGVDQAASRGAALATVLPRRRQCNAVTAAPAAANDITSKEQVCHTYYCSVGLGVLPG